jgi:hypothetical protein
MSLKNHDWEEQLSRRLRALPQQRAPGNLIPGVLAKIAARQSPVWWRRPWLEWPRALQISSGLLFAALVACIFWWQDSATLFVRQAATNWLEHWTLFKAAWAIAQTTFAIAQTLIASVKTLYWVIAAFVALVLYFSVIALGGLFCRVAGTKS